MVSFLFKSVPLLLSLVQLVFAVARNSPLSGALVVRAGSSASGEYATINKALAALPNDSSARSIFVYAGTYREQVYITRSGAVTIYGQTSAVEDHKNNVVTLAFGRTASEAGSNDASGTLRIHQNGFRMYNVNVKNTYGVGTQAIALSNYGSKVGLYGCGFYGYQDTLYANQGTHVYLRGYIEGRTDFIFGRKGQAYFESNVIAPNGKGWITASGREGSDSAVYTFNANTIQAAAGADSATAGNVYLGRPWGAYARVIFKNTQVNLSMNRALWSIWNSGDERTSNVFLADYNTVGNGASGASRPGWAKVLSANEANSYTIATTVGGDWASWVDRSYLI